MHSNILVKQFNRIDIEGHCHGFQTELDFVEKNGILIPIDTGRMVPHTEWRQKNTIKAALFNYIAYKLGTDTTDNALDLLFTSSGTKAGVGAAMAGRDGIIEGTEGVPVITHLLLTTLNDGGTNAEAYIEFYGHITGSINLVPHLFLGHNYDNAGNGDFGTIFSTVSISQTVAASRRYHHYWKITFAAA